MKKTFTTLLAAFTILCAIAANNRVIENPVYEFKTTGIMHITKIELDENETRLHVHAIFMPNWWVSFSLETVIENSATGERWQPIELIGGEFDERIFMPASGDSTFVLIFPPLDESVTKINFIHVGNIFGISLDPETPPRCREIPDDVLQWIDNELAQARRQTMMNFEAGEFFAADTARLAGYIRGYDRRAGFSTGMIFGQNVITREDNPVVVQIHEDGRFEAVIPMSYPKYSTVSFPHFRINIPFYIQPGQTLAMLLDWEEFLMADRLRDAPYTFKNIQFKGVAAEMNNELVAFKAQLPNLPVRRIYDGMENRSPNEFISFLNETMLDYNNAFQRLLATKNLSEAAKNLLQNDFQIQRSLFLFDFASRHRWQNQSEVPIEFYGFLQDISMNDRELLSTQNFPFFINRFEFAEPFMQAERQVFTPAVTFHQYLFERLNLAKTPEDEAYFALVDSLRSKLQSREIGVQEFSEQYSVARNEFNKRHQEHFYAWREKYAPPILTPLESSLKRMRIRDSVLTDVLNLEPGIVYDVTKIRRLSTPLQNMNVRNKEHNLNVLIGYVANIPEPFLRQEAARLFIQNLPITQGQIGEELPDTYAANIFRELIAPFKGKTVLVNFWGIFCSPCIATIREQKALRDRYKDSAEIAFVFITCERSSPLDRYREFVEEQELTHSFRIPADQHNHLMQLFRFLGIPHYVLVDRQGRILNDNFRVRLNVSAPLLPQLSN